ncbi:hypothetical protein CPB83DRAFT_845249 [Crepidotus variabilis]|uniref:F-box domain-containing protein n=1 Tax=Crepidotus variabilis TaxID=179855 RepID=A0A9P6EQC4_9AGAR|nr:hypothetical protein CPB83DRAFT_845249 [Crepidotus variabilis]
MSALADAAGEAILNGSRPSRSKSSRPKSKGRANASTSKPVQPKGNTTRPPAKRRRTAEDDQHSSVAGPSVSVEEEPSELDEEGSDTASDDDRQSTAQIIKISARKKNKEKSTSDESNTIDTLNKDDAVFPKTPPFCSLPLELLAEILIYTGSPQHVLAVARSCKFLCDTLLGTNAQFIWRAARKSSACAFEKEIPETPQLGWMVNAGGMVVQVTQPTPAPDGGPRKEFVHLPDPHRCFTEASFAAFVFDAGKCDVCGKMTSVPYQSFALRIRRCKDFACQKQPKGLTRLNPLDDTHDLLKTFLAVNECYLIPSGHFSTSEYWPNNIFGGNLYAKTEEVIVTLQEVSLRRDDREFKRQCDLRGMRQQEWMKFCVKVARWKFDYNEQRKKIEQENVKMAKNTASKFGWDYTDFLTATLFGPFHRLKNKCLELVDETDIIMKMEDIEQSLLKLEEKRGRSHAETSLMENRKDVETLYNRLRSQKDHKFFPSLPTFRQLPVIALLQSGEHDGPRGKTPVANTLQNNPMMKDFLNKQLAQWVAKAKQDLGVTLGFPSNWKSANKNILHPVERMTARFLCTKCDRVDAKYKGDGCLDFAGACKHVCFIGSTRKQRTDKKAAWDPKIFMKDTKAINALKKCIEATDFKEDRESAHHILKIGFAAVCTSCEPPMVVDSRSIVGHSHRHDDMQLLFKLRVKQVEEYLGGLPYEHGLVEKFVYSNNTQAASTRREIAKKNYGCRHCLRIKQVEAAVSATNAAAMIAGESTDTTAEPQAVSPAEPQAASEGTGQIQLSTVVHRLHEVQISGPREKPPALFIFNGLRSHLKAKHGIEDIRDEDLFCWDLVDL